MIRVRAAAARNTSTATGSLHSGLPAIQPAGGLDATQMKQIHVVAGVIRDALGRILLARRTEGRDLAGLWEFPGGKVEPGEPPEAALARELHEELGIHARVGAALIRVPQQYPDKRLLLDVRLITGYNGTPRGLDGQALAWAPAHKLAQYPMPPADRPVVAALLQPDRYLVTPTPADSDGHWLSGLDHALASGVQRVQLRAHGPDPGRWARLAGQAVARCRAAGADVLVNADLALAAALGAGLHLQAAQLDNIEVQRSLRKARPRMLGASCHTAGDLLRAQALGCDFVVLGHVQDTLSHPGVPGIGWQAFAGMREAVALPIYAIGGLGVDDIEVARAHGAQGIAAIRGLWPR